MEEHNCVNCHLRIKYDVKPKSLVGRFWKWHIKFCPGWLAYLESLDEDKKPELKLRYKLK